LSPDLPAGRELEFVRRLARAVGQAGGRALVVGGTPRDLWAGRTPRDLDVEVHGLSEGRLRGLLSSLGDVERIGRAFPVLIVRGWGSEFSLARQASAATQGASDFERAARHRDLTINAIAIDPLTGEWLDPLGGRADIESRRLRAADPEHFGADPLRGLRVARLAACLDMTPDEELLAACRGLDLAGLPGERMLGEIDRMLLEAEKPSLGLEVLRSAGQLPVLPQLEALIGVEQDPRWHPEGDVWIHTAMVVDVAAHLCDGGGDDRSLMYAALCHDLGKPLVSEGGDGRVRAFGHERAGSEPTRALLERLRAPSRLVTRVCALVEHHLAPFQLPSGGASPRAYRRLARRLGGAGVSLELLERVGRADQLGRTTEDALAGRAPDCDAFKAKIAELELARVEPRDAVLGRHLTRRGHEPGPGMGRILELCRDVQDETGWSDPDRILERVLAARNQRHVTASDVPRAEDPD
jgi:tRNA nucleotidyltransferase (CCA-adding enzyme)